MSHSDQDDFLFIDQQIFHHQGLSGISVLEKGEEALLARAWLADHAKETIDVQYFIWSSDNIGILATEALLRAADRGIQVRVIVDDLLIDSPDKALLALALHPNIVIRIYNPKHSVGTPFYTRILHVFTDFRGVNQRMHDKTFIVDGKVAITGGRNMADEYFDYDHAYNFRDRDALVVGEVVGEITENFNEFWNSELSVTVEDRFSGMGIMQKYVTVDNHEIKQIYNDLHDYAASTDNFSPEVKDMINAIPQYFEQLAKDMVWADARFISDAPGKNADRGSFDSGGLSTAALAGLIENAKDSILIQSPYLVLSDKAETLFRAARDRGVTITISTNSLSSTDNLQAFSGYKNQRDDLLAMGIEIYEYKAFPDIQRDLLQRYSRLKDTAPVFAIHAKTMVIDAMLVFIGTFNLDPRSENLNTEVGVVIENEQLAKSVTQAIHADMEPANSWNARNDPDQRASLIKRLKVLFWQLLPIKPLL